MENVSCPQCGNPNLDVDSQNNVVYCKKCGFAVQVDPKTGNVTPISQGGQTQTPAAYSAAPSTKTVFGTDPLTFFLLASAVMALLFFMKVFDPFDLEAFFLAEIILFWYYWTRR
ncbi:MAG: hypothetical protein ACE5DI_01900 [Candidatus Micrarchaeia archaeon]